MARSKKPNKSRGSGSSPDSSPSPAQEPTLGRPAFPANVLPIGRDPSLPAGAVHLQVPKSEGVPDETAARKTLTLMNPTPTAAATPSPKKRGG